MPSVDEDAWYVLLSFGQLSSGSFIRLSWFSGQLRRLCKQIAADKSAAQALLLQAISAASAQLEPVNAPAAFESNNAAIPNLCFEQKLAWLKKQAPKFLQDGRVMAAALQQHNVPRPVATALLRHGAQFTWQQLQDAARRLVPGLQVWVELSRELQLPLHASVPHIAAAICCGEELGLQSPQQWGLPADASPAALSSRRLELLPGLAQLAVALPRDGGATAALQSLCSLQEAQDLASSTVAGLLKAALHMGASERVKVLMRLPAVRELDDATALQLLQSAVERRLTHSVRQLSAAGVSSEDAAVLLHAAVDSSSTAMVAELVQLQGVQAPSFDTTLSLLQASMHSSEPQLPAALAAGLPAALLQQLQPVNVNNKCSQLGTLDVQGLQQLKEDTTSLRQALRSAGIHRESLSYKQYSAFDKLPNTVKGMLAWAQLLQQPLFLRAGEEAALELEAQHLLLLKAAVADVQVQLGVLDPKFLLQGLDVQQARVFNHVPTQLQAQRQAIQELLSQLMQQLQAAG
ncbi:hypothetical protein OEZ86_007173 [Tetradesmus obliquus]|nr:hypothetical protein OEZ86_007173 [Tetradesmus obliquus]